MGRVKGGLFTTLLDVNKRFPLDTRMLVTKREDLINPTVWITNTLTTDATYNGMIVAVNTDGEYNGVYYLADRKAITADNYTLYQADLAAGKDVEQYFSMWIKLGTLDNIAAVESELNKVKEKIGEVPEDKTIVEMIAEVKPTIDLKPVDGTIVIANTENGGKAIGVSIAPVAGNALVAVEGGLFVPTVSGGNGIEVVDNKVNVKLAESTHGLVAVNGALTLNLATKNSDGAMSKEDKKKLDAIPEMYEAIKYDISNVPAGTLVDYRDREIRIMCPADAEFTKQAVGTGGDANTYYMTLRTYAPDNAVGYREHLGNQSDSEILTDLKTDEYGRIYQPTWLGLAKFDEVTGVWTYYGKNSSIEKFIGWDYRIDWYDAEGVIVASNSVRINLSNESCHNINKPYYMANYVTSTEIEAIKDSVEESREWGTF